MPGESRPDNQRTAQGWDTYWRGTGDVGAWTAGGANHPAIRSFWSSFFEPLKQAWATPSMADIASGNGALVECALGIFKQDPLDVTCIDVSAAAIANIRERFPAVHGLVCDARSIPLESQTFDMVTSQFGVEYAGVGAIDEAARLLAPGGRMALLLHHSAGSIHRECAASLDAITRLRESAFIPLAIDMFRTGFAAVRGADRAPYEAAALMLAPAVTVLEQIIKQHGEHVAGDTMSRLYGDVASIHGQLAEYDPDEVLAWLARLEGELAHYAVRMSSMMDSAIDPPGFEWICARLEERMSIEQAGPLVAHGQDLPLAWVIRATGRQQRQGAVGSEETSVEKKTGNDKDLQAWIRQQYDTAVRELMKRGLVESIVVESRPAWVLPYSLLIGKIRDQSRRGGFDWFICGDAPLTHADSSVARTPREAARHFALQWQIDAARQGQTGAGLAEKAGALYQIVEDASFWGSE